MAAGIVLLVFVLVLGFASCGSAPGSLHRSSIVLVRSWPAGETLQKHDWNTLQFHPDLGLAIAVGNPSGSPEKNVAVTVTVERRSSPLVLRKFIDRLDSGATRTLTFRGLDRVWPTSLTTVVVESQAASGVRSLAAYPVVFADRANEPVVPVGGLHGTGLVFVKSLPGRKPLSPRHHNAVAGTRPGFLVGVKNTGDSREQQIKVSVTIRQYPNPIVATKTIPVIDPGQVRAIAFRNLGAVAYATRSTLLVDIQSVPGEKNRANNAASYPVIFSLG